MTRPHALRFFVTVLRPPLSIVGSDLLIAAWAAYLVAVGAGDFRPPYVVLLFCQAFGASTGFFVRASRGHFDAVLVAPAARVRVGLTHAVVSTAPGLVTWLVLVAIEAVTNRGQWPLGLTLPALAALIYVSAFAWAAAIPFSRFSSGVVWMVLAIVLAGAGKLLPLRDAYLAMNGTWADVWKAAGAALVFPPFMVTESFGPRMAVVVCVLGVSFLALAIGIRMIAALDVTLVDPS